jgi:hypothetical protein
LTKKEWSIFVTIASSDKHVSWQKFATFILRGLSKQADSIVL